MQMLFDLSEECSMYDGFGAWPGFVQAVLESNKDGRLKRLPHIGWKHLHKQEVVRYRQGTLLESMLGEYPAVHFVHFFFATPFNTAECLADCLYGGNSICAAVQRDNSMASQFYPKRSGEIGLEIIRRFLSI